MRQVRLQKQWQVEEHFLALADRNLVRDPVFITIAFIPIEAGDIVQVDHICILP